MSDTNRPILDPDLAVTRNDLRHVEQSLQALMQTVGALDSKIDLMNTTMRETYLTTTEWGRWKKEDYQPHKESTETQFQRQGERISKWLGGLYGTLFAGVLTLAVYLIVAAVGHGPKP